MQQTSVSWWLTVRLLRQILFSFPGLANVVYFFKGDCLQVLGFRNNLPHVLTGGKDYTHWWNKWYVCVYPGCITLLPRSLHVKSCRDRLIISSGFQEKGGCPLIRACSVITSNTVLVMKSYYDSKSGRLVCVWRYFLLEVRLEHVLF